MPVNNMVNTDTFIPQHSHLSGPRRGNKSWWSARGIGRVLNQQGSRLQLQTSDYRHPGLNPKPSQENVGGAWRAVSSCSASTNVNQEQSNLSHKLPSATAGASSDFSLQHTLYKEWENVLIRPQQQCMDETRKRSPCFVFIDMSQLLWDVLTVLQPKNPFLKLI